MDLSPDSDHSKALHHNSYNTHCDFLNMSEEDRIALYFVNDTNNKILLNRGYKSLVQIFQAYVYCNNIDTSDVTKVNCAY